MPLIEKNPDFQVQRTPSLRHFSFDMDTKVTPFDNPDVRQALKYAIDRDDIIDKVFLGEGSKGNDNPVAVIQKYHHDIPQREYNIEKAKEHLAKAGLDTVSVDLSVAENAFPGAIDSRQQQTVPARAVPAADQRLGSDRHECGHGAGQCKNGGRLRSSVSQPGADLVAAISG